MKPKSRSVRDVIANPTPEETAQLKALRERLQGVRPRPEGMPQMRGDVAPQPPTLEEIEEAVRRVVREELDARGL